MAVPPTLVQHVQTSWTSTASPKSLTVTVQVGDLIVVAAGAAGSGNNFGISGGAMIWQLRTSSYVSSRADMALWTVQAPNSGTFTITVSDTSSQSWGASATVWRNHGGIGNYGKATGDDNAQANFTLSSDDSAAVVYIMDYNAIDGSGRQWWSVAGTAATEIVYGRSSVAYTWYGAYYADTNAAASRLVGLDEPDNNLKWTMAVLEIKGTATGIGAQTATPATVPSTLVIGEPSVSYGVATSIPTTVPSTLKIGNPIARVDTWRQLIERDSWKNAVTAHQRTVGYRAAMIDQEGQHVVDVPLTSGSIDFDGEAAEQWACQVTIPGEEWIARGPGDYLDPRSGLRIRLWWRLLINGGWVEIPVGTFVLEDPRISDNGAMPTTSLRGRDPLTIIRRAGYGSLVVSVGGLTVPAALERIMRAVAPQTPFRIESSSTRTLPATYELTGQDPLDDMVTIARQSDLIIRTDPEGNVVAAPNPDSQIIRADWQEGPDCPVTDLTRAVNTSQMLNSVTVVSTNPEVIPPISVTVEDTDPSSDTWIGGPWGRRATTIRTDSIASEAAARSMAQGILNGRRRPQEEISVEVPPRGDLLYRDKVALKRTMSGVANTYRVAGWNLSFGNALEAPATMGVKMISRTIVE
jgi:hypothetical protein